MRGLLVSSDDFFMSEALKQARRAAEQDEVPVGAVIVRQDQIIARAHNQVELLRDPTAHAEMLAITQAASAVGGKWLLDCTLYVTLEPCCMCAGAIVLARLRRLCFGARDPKGGACGSVANVVQNPALNHRVAISDGILADECGQQLTAFFQKKRGLDKEKKILD